MTSQPLPAGSTIVVTGVNGYIASHVADQLLSLGYVVRGIARDDEKVRLIRGVLLQRQVGAVFEGVSMPDYLDEEKLRDAFEGSSAVVHMAADLSLNTDPNLVVPPAVEAMVTILNAAAATPTLKRFVLTSSSLAAFKPSPDKSMVVGQESWNEEDLAEAWKPPPYHESRGLSVYAAGKIAAERAAWKFVSENEPDFAMNSVLPTIAFGPILGKCQSGSTAGAVRGLYEGDERLTKFLLSLPPQRHVDVRDAAAIHVAAIIYPDVKGQRLFACAESFDFNRTITILKEIDPFWTAPQEEGVKGQDMCNILTSSAEQLLERLGRDGFTTYDKALKDQFSNVQR